nr:hypothetical protein [Tanacetum cinerariifolium]
MDLFNLTRAPNPTKVKTGSRPRAPHEVPLLTLTATRVIEMDNPAVATDSSEMPPSEDVPTTDVPGAGQAEETTATDPHTALKSRKRGRDGTDVNASPKSLRRDHADPQHSGSSHGGKSLAAIQLGFASTVFVPEDAPAGVSDPDPLSFTDPPSRHPADVSQSSQGTAAAGDPESENASSRVEVAMGSQLRLRFEQEAKLLRKSVAQVARRDKRIQARELEIKNLKARLETEADMKKAAEDKNAGLIQELEDIHARFSDLQAAFEEFKRYEDDRLERQCAELDARLDALSIDFDEELYPHMLTAIVGRRHGVEHGQAKLNVESIKAYDPETKAKFVAALQALKDLKYPLVDQLEGLKDVPMDVIMAALYLESDTGEVRDPRNPWAYKEEMLLADAIAANIIRAEKKKKCRIVCRTHGFGSAHHARSDGVSVSVPIVVPQVPPVSFVCSMRVFTISQRLGYSIKDTESVAAKVATHLCGGPCTKIHGS